MDLSYDKIKKLYKQKKAQILCRCVLMNLTAYVFADVKLKGGNAPLMIMSVKPVVYRQQK